MTKSDILSEVVKRTGRRDVANIDVELSSVLRSVTTEYDFLQGKDEIITADNIKEYDLPEYCNKIKAILNEEGYGITQAPIEYLLKGKFRGTPTYYTRFGYKKLLLYPIPDGEYKLDIYYSYTHPDNIDLILLDNRFKELLISGVCYEVWKGKGEAELGEAHRVAFYEQINKLTPLLSEYGYIEYNDL